MLRITPIKNGHGLVLKLEGQLIGPWVDELQLLCAGVNGDGGILKLDLADLNYADHAGARLLARLMAGRAELSACSGFLRAQIESHAAGA